MVSEAVMSGSLTFVILFGRNFQLSSPWSKEGAGGGARGDNYMSATRGDTCEKDVYAEKYV